MTDTDNLLLLLAWCATVCTVFLGMALVERWAERRAQKRRDKYLFLARLVAEHQEHRNLCRLHGEGEPNG